MKKSDILECLEVLVSIMDQALFAIDSQLPKLDQDIINAKSRLETLKGTISTLKAKDQLRQLNKEPDTNSW